MLGSFGKFGIITSVLIKLFPTEKTFFNNNTVPEVCLNNFTNTDYALFSRIKKEIDPKNILV
jgi:FAD/FMN-containing dehydrogenase